MLMIRAPRIVAESLASTLQRQELRDSASELCSTLLASLTPPYNLPPVSRKAHDGQSYKR